MSAQNQMNNFVTTVTTVTLGSHQEMTVASKKKQLLLLSPVSTLQLIVTLAKQQNTRTDGARSGKLDRAAINSESSFATTSLNANIVLCVLHFSSTLTAWLPPPSPPR